ncbi:hypothetical protein FG386_000137 [Cryptosporidium ryanae]|uniref:uncharacterized protein n=1 Tax=Cryptosporidium ryanae TaxID=515981 RepID=UPI00351A9562|nr:hypothetical protein FG386_000137 [Cryptosporidium ryanae]
MLDESHCVICREIEFHQYKELSFIRCKYCEGYFHRLCYGFSNSGDENNCVIICDPCRFELRFKGEGSVSNVKSDDYKCIVCFRGGKLKRVLLSAVKGVQENIDYCSRTRNSSVWVHVDCAIYSPKHLQINDWRTLSCIEIVSKIPFMNPYSCCYCKNRIGLMHFCSHDSCNKIFHIHCLISDHIYNRKNVIIRKDMIVEAYCHDHYSTDLVSVYNSELTESTITEYTREMNFLGKDRNLDVYINNVFEFMGKDYFVIPEYLRTRPIYNLTLLSIIITSDIWTLRSSGFLSMLSRKITLNREYYLESMTRWIDLSTIIPVSYKFKNIITGFYESLTQKVNVIKNRGLYMSFDEISKIMDDDMFYCFDVVREILKKNNIIHWENKNKHLLVNNDITGINMDAILKAIRECSGYYKSSIEYIGRAIYNSSCNNRKSKSGRGGNVNRRGNTSNSSGGGSSNNGDTGSNADDRRDENRNRHIGEGDSNSIKRLLRSSRLYRFVSKINRKADKLTSELIKLVNNKVVNIDKLRYLMNRVDKELPGNSVLVKDRSKKILNYSLLIESRVGRELSLLFNVNRNWNKSKVDIRNSFENKNFRLYSSQLFGLENNLTVIDKVLSLDGFFKYANNGVDGTEITKQQELWPDSSTLLPRERPERSILDSVEKEYMSYCKSVRNRHIYCSHFSRKVASLKIRLMLSSINKVEMWMLDVSELHSSYLNCTSNTDRRISRQVCDKMGMRDKYLLFCSYFTDAECSKRDVYFSKMRKMNIEFEKNKVLFSKLKFSSRFLRLRVEYDSLEKFLNRLDSSNLTFSMILCFMDGVLQGVFRLLPSKSRIPAFFERLRLYFSLVDYLDNHIEKTSHLRMETIHLLRLYMDEDSNGDAKQLKLEERSGDSEAASLGTAASKDGEAVEGNSTSAAEDVSLNANEYLDTLVADLNDRMKRLLDKFVIHYNFITNLYFIIENTKTDDLLLKPSYDRKIKRIMDYIIDAESRVETVYDSICLLINSNFKNMSVVNDKRYRNQFVIKDHATISEYYYYLLKTLMNTNLGRLIRSSLIENDDFDSSIDCDNTYTILYNWEVKLFQKFSLIYILHHASQMSDSDIDSNLDKTSLENQVKYINLIQYIPRKLLCLDNRTMLLIWRKLRLIDYSTIHLSVDYFGSTSGKSSTSEEYSGNDCDSNKYEQNTNDKWYNFLMNYLTERLALYINNSLLSGRSVTGTLDDYYFDLKYIYSKKIYAKLDISKLVFDYEEFKSLSNEVDDIICLVNKKNFELKRIILNRFTSNNFSEYCGDSVSNSRCFHQPMSYNSVIMSKYVDSDFETNFNNDFYQLHPPERIYSDRATSKLSSGSGVLRQLFSGSKGSVGCSDESFPRMQVDCESQDAEDPEVGDDSYGKSDFAEQKREIENLSFEEMFNMYMGLMEEERNLILLSLNHSKKLKVSRGLSSIRVSFVRDEECICRIMKMRKELVGEEDEFESADRKGNLGCAEKKRKIYDFLSRLVFERREKINRKLEFMSDVVNYYSNVEISFLFNLYKISLKKIQVNNVKLCDWFNYDLMTPSSSYYTFLEISDIFDPVRLESGFAIYSLIFGISNHYTGFVCDWNELFDDLESCFSDKSRVSGKNRYYDVLLLYNKSKIMKILLHDFSKNNPYYCGNKASVWSRKDKEVAECGDFTSNCDFGLDDQGRSSNIIKRLCEGVRYEKEFERKYKRTVNMYLKLRISEFFSFQPLCDYMNGVFRDITANGLYNSNLSSSFLLHFPTDLIEQIRGIKPINSSGTGLSAGLNTTEMETSDSWSDDECERRELQLELDENLGLLEKLEDECADFELGGELDDKNGKETDIASVISRIRKIKSKKSLVREMTLVYLSKETVLLAVKYSINQKSGVFYSDVSLLLELSAETRLGSNILNSVYLRRTKRLYDLHYADPGIDEHYYYCYKDFSQDFCDSNLLNGNLRAFERLLLSRISAEAGLKEADLASGECRDVFSLDSFYFKIGPNGGGAETKGLELNGKSECSSNSNASVEALNARRKQTKDGRRRLLEEKFIFISDTMDLLNNIILLRIYMRSFSSRSKPMNKCGTFNIDFARKLAIMNYSINEVTKSFVSFEDKNNALILREFSHVIKEISNLVGYLDGLKQVKRTSSLLFGHHIQERELMLMEEFNSLKAVSNLYFFTPVKGRQSIDVSQISRVFALDDKKTFLDVLDCLINRCRDISRYIVSQGNRDSTSRFTSFVVSRREKISELEKKGKGVVDAIRKDIENNKREDRYDLYGDTDIKRLMEKILEPPRTSRDDIRKVSFYELSKLIPNYELIYKTCGVKPYSNYDVLLRYYDESHTLDGEIHLILSKISSFEDKENGLSFKGGDTMNIVLHNISFLEEILKLRILIIKAKIISDKLSSAYVEYFRGITRYYLVFGTRYFFGVLPVEEPDLDMNNSYNESKNETVFVPILEYKVLKDLHNECLLWNGVTASGNSLGINKYCEFVALECYLSYSNYLIDCLSFDTRDHIDCILNENKNLSNPEDDDIGGVYYGTNRIGTFLSRNLLYSSSFYLEVPETNSLTSLIGGLVDIGEYLTEYRQFLEKEYVFLSDASISFDHEISSKRVFEVGSLTALRKKDSKVIYHFSRRRKFRVTYIEFGNKEDFGPLSNIFLLEKNIDKIKYKWQIISISQSLKPSNFLFLIRKYVRQLLEFTFGYFHNTRDRSHDLIRTKDDLIYNSVFKNINDTGKINLFTLVDKYLRNSIEYVFKLIFRSMVYRENGDELYLTDLTTYVADIRRFKDKWRIGGEYTSLNTKIMIDLGNLSREREDSSNRSQGNLSDSRHGSSSSIQNPSPTSSNRRQNNRSLRGDFGRDGSRIGRNRGKSEETRLSGDIGSVYTVEVTQEKANNIEFREQKQVEGARETRGKRKNDVSRGDSCGDEKRSGEFSGWKRSRAEGEGEGETRLLGSRSEEDSAFENKVGSAEMRERNELRERLRKHIGSSSDIKFIWLGWINLSNQVNTDNSEDILEVGFYQIGNQICRKSDYILNSLERNLNFQFTGRFFLFKDLKLDLNNSLCVLLSSNWSQNTNNYENEVFNRIFHFQYSVDNYEVFEFSLLNSEEIKLWLFPCNLDKRRDAKHYETLGDFDFPISKYYLLGIVTFHSSVDQQSELSDISILSSFLPNENQIFNIAEYCNKQCNKTNSKMEFLISNKKNMFHSAGTLLSNLISLNENLASSHRNPDGSGCYVHQDSRYVVRGGLKSRYEDNSYPSIGSDYRRNSTYDGGTGNLNYSSSNDYDYTGYSVAKYNYNNSYANTGFSNNCSGGSNSIIGSNSITYNNSGFRATSGHNTSVCYSGADDYGTTSHSHGKNDQASISTLGELAKSIKRDIMIKDKQP